MSRRAVALVSFLLCVPLPVLIASPSGASVSTAPGCTVDARLVNSCRPWLGTTAGYYPEVADYWNKQAQIDYAEQRTGRQVDVVHTYRVAGQNALRSEDVHYATRDDTLLFVNYQVTRDWASAGGGDDAVNAQIDQMAASVKALGDHTILMSVFHEPENDVTSTQGCTGITYKGTSGTPQQYRDMWRNVHDRFVAAGVTNVVWVMDYMNYAPFNCMVDELYPGDQYVDWIMWNAYQHGNTNVSFVDDADNLYDYLTDHSDPAAGRDYLSKAWGLAEWGINGSTQDNAELYYRQAEEAVEHRVLPRLSLYASFDSGDPNTGDGSYRVAYGTDGVFDQAEQDAYNDFALSWAFVGDGSAPPVDLPPSTPTGVQAVLGSGPVVSLSWSPAEDDHGVASYQVRRDGVPLETTATTSYVDLAPVAGATHSYTVTAVDTAGQAGGESQAVTVAVPKPDVTPPSRPGGLTVTLSSGVPLLTWRASTDDVGVTGYDVLRNGVPVGTTSGLSWLDTSARQGSTSTWTVRARDAAGNVSPLSSSVSRSVPDTTAPSAPGSLSVARSRTSATLTWTRATDNVGVTGYVVTRDGTVVARPGASTLRLSVGNLRAGNVYTWRVSARDAAGNVGPAVSARG